MIRKIAVSLTLALLVVGSSFAQDKVDVQDSDMVLMVKFAADDASNAEPLNDIKGSKMVKKEGNSMFFLSTSKDASESAMKEIRGLYEGVEMKVMAITAAEYKKRFASAKK